MSSDPRLGTSAVCSIAPMLSVRNGSGAVEFYKSAFGAVETYRVEDPTGAVVARLSIGGAEFWLGDEAPAHGHYSPESLGGATARLILIVPDPEAMFAKALAAGACEIFAVHEAHGWRLGQLVDPFGHRWEIGHPVASLSREG
jgi:PhnB protein